MIDVHGLSGAGRYARERPYAFADIELLQHNYPRIFSLLDLGKVKDCVTQGKLECLDTLSWEFEGLGVSGRGEAYNTAQEALENRRIGMRSLIRLFSPTFIEVPPVDYNILDVLAGDGTVASFVASQEESYPFVISSDISRFMVDASQRKGLASLRQSATDLMFGDHTLDGVLIAYGSHHLSSEERHKAVAEGHRTLKARKRLVLHDFESSSAAAQWFEEVVHPFSRTGHPHRHFTRLEMFHLLDKAGFRDVRIFDMPDPFTLYGATERQAKVNALMHMHRMYDLVKITNDQNELLSRLDHHVSQTLGEIVTRPESDGYMACIPRDALVAVGTKAH